MLKQILGNAVSYCFISLHFNNYPKSFSSVDGSFGLVGFYGISTIVGYLMPNPLYTYILNIYDLVWMGFMAIQTL